MHPSVIRLLDHAKEVTADSREPVATFAALGRRLGVSSAVMTNWKARGISKEGALAAEVSLGCSATWVLEGKGPSRSGAHLGPMTVEATGRISPPPPASPPDFSDRREVSDSDWATLTAVKTLYTHDEIEDMKTRAMEKLQETTAMLRRQTKTAGAARTATTPPPWVGPERRVHSTPVPAERRREFRNSDDIDSLPAGTRERGK